MSKANYVAFLRVVGALSEQKMDKRRDRRKENKVIEKKTQRLNRVDFIGRQKGSSRSK